MLIFAVKIRKKNLFNLTAMFQITKCDNEFLLWGSNEYLCDTLCHIGKC